MISPKGFLENRCQCWSKGKLVLTPWKSPLFIPAVSCKICLECYGNILHQQILSIISSLICEVVYHKRFARICTFIFNTKRKNYYWLFMLHSKENGRLHSIILFYMHSLCAFKEITNHLTSQSHFLARKVGP